MRHVSNAMPPVDPHFVLQVFLCYVIDNQCKDKYLRRQPTFDRYGTACIPPEMVREFMEYQQQLMPPVLLFPYVASAPLRPSLMLDRSLHTIPQLECGGEILVVSDGVRYCKDPQSFAMSLGRIVNFLIWLQSLATGPWHPMNMLGCTPNQKNLWVEIVFLYQREEVVELGVATHQPDVVKPGN